MAREYVQCAGAKALQKVVQPQAPSQVAVAKALGVTPQAVSSWIVGRTRPSRDVATRLEKQFGIPVASWSSDASDSGEHPAVPPPSDDATTPDPDAIHRALTAPRPAESGTSLPDDSVTIKTAAGA